MKVHCQGNGPAALLVHGWRGQASNLQNLTTLLVDADFQVCIPDLPGHVHSEGERLSSGFAKRNGRCMAFVS
jgi:esterase/lipase